MPQDTPSRKKALLATLKPEHQTKACEEQVLKGPPIFVSLPKLVLPFLFIAPTDIGY